MTASGADIQVEQGNYTRIHNAILERITLFDFTVRELKALLYLLRVTYGYQTTTAKLGGAEWAKGTGIKRQNIMPVIASLVARNIIIQEGESSRGRGHSASYKFNKYFDTWGQENASPSMQCTSGLKKVKKERGEKAATQPTPHQLFFEAVCKAIGWDHKTLDSRGKGQVAQTVGILADAGYSAGDVDTFMTAVWVRDWRWVEKQSFPTLNQLRQEIGKVRAVALAGAAPSSPLQVDFSVEEIL